MIRNIRAGIIIRRFNILLFKILVYKISIFKIQVYKIQEFNNSVLQNSDFKKSEKRNEIIKIRELDFKKKQPLITFILIFLVFKNENNAKITNLKKFI